MKRSWVGVVAGCVVLLGVSLGTARTLDLPRRWFPATRYTYFAHAGKHIGWELGQAAALQTLSSALRTSPASTRYSVVYEKIPKHAFGIVPRQILAYNRPAQRLMHGDEESPERCTVLTHVSPELIHAVAAHRGDFAALQRRHAANSRAER